MKNNNKNTNNIIIFLLIFIFIFVFNSCIVIKKEQEKQKEKKDFKVENTTVTSEPIEVEPDLEQAQIRSVIPKNNLKVGIIFGPGGSKVYSYIGILESFLEAQIPINAVVGIEWGAIIAALYAQKKQVFHVEWKMQKLNDEYFPSKGIFSSGIQPQDINKKMSDFFNLIFNEDKIEDNKIAFACPTLNQIKNEVTFIDEGMIANAMKKCIPFLPYFKPYKNQIAASDAIRDSANYLKEKDSNLIILIDVISQSDIFHPTEIVNEFQANIVWNEIKKSIFYQRVYVDEFITVNTSKYSISDFQSKRELIEIGREEGKIIIKNLIEKFGF